MTGSRSIMAAAKSMSAMSGGSPKGGAALAELGLGPKVFFTSRICAGIVFHCAGSEASSASISAFSAVSASYSRASSISSSLRRRAQAGVEDGVGLDFGELEAGHQGGLRLVLLADDADHLVEVEIDDEQAAQDLQAAVDLAEAVAGAALQHHAAVVDPFPQRLGEADHTSARRPPTRTFMLSGMRALQLGQPEQRFHQHGRIDRARARLQHDADVLGRFVAHVGEQRQLLLLQQLGHLLDQPPLRDAVGDLGDDDVPGAAAEILLVPAGADPEARRGRSGRPRRSTRRESTRMPPVGKSGPCTNLTAASDVASGWSIR